MTKVLISLTIILGSVSALAMPYTLAASLTPNVNAYYGPVKGSTGDGQNFTKWNGRTYVTCQAGCGSFTVSKANAVVLHLPNVETFVSGTITYLNKDGSVYQVAWQNGAEVPLQLSNGATLYYFGGNLYNFKFPVPPSQ